MSLLARIKRLRDGPLRFLGPLWALPRALWLFIKGCLRLRRWALGRWFARPGVAAQIHLSWPRAPHSSFTVTWWTPSGENPATLEFRAADQCEWRAINGASQRSPGVTGWIHRATATGLDPAQVYIYRVSNDAGASPAFTAEYRTRTAPATGPADFRFAFVCDTGLIGREDGNADGTQAVLQALIEARPLLLLGAGDFAYANADHRFDAVGDAVDAWFDQYQPLLSHCPMQAQYGNHEIFLKERFRDWAPRFAHPPGFDDQRNYSFRVADVHFASVFVPGPPYPSAAQLDWLERDLAAARSDSGIRWLVVFQHEPIYGHGTSHPANPAIRAALMPLCERYAVDLHLSGHDQSYERSFPLSGSVDAPRIMSVQENLYVQGEGVIYAKISPGGKRSEIGHDFSRFTSALPDLIAVADDTAHHYAVIDVSAQGGLLFTAYALLPDAAPRIIDRFEIVAD